MMRRMLKSKLHRGTVTEANVDYEGSITIDADLMKKADILPYEEVHVLSVDNGARLTTYAIEGPPGSGVICVNGAAARLIHKGHTVIILTYQTLDDRDSRDIHPTLCYLDKKNRIERIGHQDRATVTLGV